MADQQTPPPPPASPPLVNEDAILSELLGMGFDYIWAKKALALGCQTVESAADWVIQAMEAAPAVTGRLTLPAIPPSPAPAPVPSLLDHLQASSSHQSTPTPVVVLQVEEPLAQSAKLVTSKYDNATKSVFRDKVAMAEYEKVKQMKAEEKRAKSRVLDQIKEDREALRRKVAMKSTESGTPATDVAQKGKSASSDSTTSNNTGGDIKIQVRFPSGKAIRHSFSNAATLADLFSFVHSQASGSDLPACRREGGPVLLQPFPRKTFDETMSTLTLTLVEVGLSNASLVLMKPEVATEGTIFNAPSTAMTASPAANRAQARPPTLQTRPIGILPYPLPNPGGVPMPDTDATNNAEDEDMDEADGSSDPSSEPDDDGSQSDDDDMDEDDEPPRMPVFGGNGYRLIDAATTASVNLESAPQQRAVNREERAHSIQQRLQNEGDLSSMSADTSASHTTRRKKALLPLTDLCVEAVAKLISNPATPAKSIAKLKRIGFASAEKLASELISNRLLDRFSATRLAPCAITTYSLNSYPLATDSLLEAIGMVHWLTLTTLSLNNAQYVTDTGVASLAGLPALERLSLSYTKISTEGIRNMALGLKGTLTDLRLAGCRNITGKEMKMDKVMVAFAGMSLESLDLENFVGVNDEVVSGLERARDTLLRLCLNSTKVSDAFGPQVVKFNQLRELHLDHTAITDAFSSHLKNGMPHLCTLSLAGNRSITDLTLQNFPEAMWRRTLKKLNLARTSVTDEGVRVGIVE
ncbi:hypothetical protein HDV05_004273, partial [Chytridiales sp. JEL 0842]